MLKRIEEQLSLDHLKDIGSFCSKNEQLMNKVMVDLKACNMVQMVMCLYNIQEVLSPRPRSDQVEEQGKYHFGYLCQ
ncbi:hypothetical protein L6452_17435 [Arctium lappa]|uniref:Uncharacterized protein n=1 Tax=Arctium lappa TaxID=4217 RepID=A0ACB9C3A0_ARCLA|nr:hypothetical protein L6452_17435 [Arctium lappa]